MAEIPRRLIRDCQSALHLISRDAFLGLTNEIDRKKPLPQWQVRVMEDRTRRDGELIAAGIAVKLRLLLKLGNALGLTTGTFDAFRPAKVCQIVAALVAAAEFLNQVYKVNVGLERF